MSLNTTLRTFWKWLNRRSAAGRTPARRMLSLEALEAREVPAVTASFGGSILGQALFVQGTEAKDNILVLRTPTSTSVTNNGVAVPITVAGVAANSVSTSKIDVISITGLGGDDQIQVLTYKLDLAMPRSTQVVIDAGYGNDVVYADTSWSLDPIPRGGVPQASPTGNKVTVYGGDGDDTLSGGFGNDTFYGGFGRDTFCGNGGADTVNDATATFDTTTGQLRVIGTANNDVFTVRQEAGDIRIVNDDIALTTAYGPAGRVFWVSAREVRSIVVEGMNGDDQMTLQLSKTGTFLDANNIELSATVYGGVGNDRIDANSWKGSVWVDGGANNDTIYGTQTSDTLYGGPGNDYLYGYGGNDWLIGQDGADSLSGGTGDDRLYGSEYRDTTYNDGYNFLYGEDGNDFLHGGNGTDYLYGGANDDDLYGSAGNDYLYGGDHNDGLFGGAGVNTLDGGAGSNRLLVWSGAINSFSPVSSSSVVIPFQDSGPQTFIADSKTVMYGAGTWTDAQIERLDVALGNLHRFTGNTRLLQMTPGVAVRFERMGDAANDEARKYDAFNNGVRIAFTQIGIDESEMQQWSTVYHELGHNWDDPSENRHATAFRQISDWRQGAVAPTMNHIESTGRGDDWWYTGNAFARDYGKTNPREDYATTFETYCMLKFHGTTNGNNNIAAKQANIDLLMADLRLS